MVISMHNGKPVNHETSTPHYDIVIVGGGFGGVHCARTLEHAFRRSSRSVLLLDQRNYMLFYPFLIEAGTGALEPRHAVVATRNYLRHSSFRMARVTDIDFGRHEVTYSNSLDQDESKLTYEHVVLAPGSITQLPSVPGLDQYGFTLQGMSDAVQLRDRALQLLEAASLCKTTSTRRAALHFVIVGGSFSGAELAGELLAFMRSAARRYDNIAPDDIRVTLIDREDRILHTLSAPLAKYAAHHLARLGVSLRLNESVTQIKAESAKLQSGVEIPTKTVIWCAGIAPNPLIERLSLPINPKGYVVTEPDGRVVGHDYAWAIGDCAANPSPDGDIYPATAQHAVRQGKLVGRNIVRVLDRQSTRASTYRTRGMLVPLGGHKAVATVLGIKVSGTFAWWLYRTAYLLMMPGFARKLRVALDWNINCIFARDHVQLGLARPRPALNHDVANHDKPAHETESNSKASEELFTPQYQN